MNEELKRAITKLYELGAEWGLKVIGAFVILFIGLLVANLLTKFINSALKKAKIDETLIGFLSGVISVILKVFVWLMFLSNLGVQTTSFIAVIGSVGLAVGLALQGSLANMGAGVLLIILRPFKVGDFVTCAGHSGTLKEIGMIYAVVITTDNKKIIIPNSKITADSIINFSAMDTRRAEFVFGVSYNDDLKKAKEILIELVNSDERVIKDPAPTVVVSSLGDSSVNFTVRAWLKSSDFWAFTFAMNERVKLAFDEQGITIPYPQHSVHLHGETKVAA